MKLSEVSSPESEVSDHLSPLLGGPLLLLTLPPPHLHLPQFPVPLHGGLRVVRLLEEVRRAEDASAVAEEVVFPALAVSDLGQAQAASDFGQGVGSPSVGVLLGIQGSESALAWLSVLGNLVDDGCG